MKRGFGSDNHAPIHPRLLEALVQANSGHAPSYGTDEESERCRRLFRDHFGPTAESFLVFNGSAANMLALRALMKPGQAVFCSENAHIHVDECAGPEFFTAGKVIPVPARNGKIGVEALNRLYIRKGDQHYPQARVLSLSQPTEYGTLYTIDELQTLIAWAKERGLFVHLDGARLPLAAAALGVSFKALTTDLGVDVVSFGGAKSGLLLGEAVVFLTPGLSKDFQYLRKQAGQLPSKTRFLAAQFNAFLENDLWRDIADQARANAKLLGELVRGIPGVDVTTPVESNAVFAKIPKAWVAKLREKHFFYVWDENTFECRWMTSWDTTREDVESFAASLKELSR